MINKQDLYNVFASLESEEDVRQLFEDLLTEKEIAEIQNRWQLIKSLFSGKTQRRVQAETKVSIATVSRGAKLLKKKQGILRTILEGFSSQDKEFRDISDLRKEIDEIDDKIIMLLEKRFGLMPEIAQFKKNNLISLEQKDREESSNLRRKKLSKEFGIEENFIESLFSRIIFQSKKIQVANLLSHQLNEVSNLKKQFPEFKLPLQLILKNDQETPASLYKKLTKDEPYSFIFEEYEKSNLNPRYSYLGMKPKKIIYFKDRVFQTLDLENYQNYVREFDDPLKILQEEIDKVKLVKSETNSKFIGGAIGFFSFDAIRYFDQSISLSYLDDLTLPEAIYGFYDEIITFDHQEQTIIITKLIDLKGDIEKKYQETLDRFFKIVCLFDESPQQLFWPVNFNNEEIDFTSNFERREFVDAAKKLKKEITSGNTRQINLSQRFETKTGISNFDLYCTMKKNNSATTFYFNYPEFSVIGGKSKVFISYDEGKNIQLNLFKTNNQTEQSLVSLILDEIETFSKNGLSEVEIPKNIEVSNTTAFYGELKSDFADLDILKKIFSTCLFSGSPNLRSLELIGQYEKYRRGMYGGIINYIDYRGNIGLELYDSIATQKGEFIYLQTGCIVSTDSIPESVYQDSLSKAKCFLISINQAHPSNL